MVGGGGAGLEGVGGEPIMVMEDDSTGVVTVDEDDETGKAVRTGDGVAKRAPQKKQKR